MKNIDPSSVRRRNRWFCTKYNSLEQVGTKKRVKSLVGIEDFENLNSLVASNNDISGVLDFFNKQLAYVDLPFNPLEDLF